jgi:hypothetical protein
MVQSSTVRMVQPPTAQTRCLINKISTQGKTPARQSRLLALWVLPLRVSLSLFLPYHRAHICISWALPQAFAF